MGIPRSSRAMVPAVAIFAALALVTGAAWAIPSETTVIFSFAEDTGEYPSTELVMDGAGNLYGTAVTGGDFGSGTVYQLSPSGDTWTQTVLHHFTSGADGGQPYGGVTLDAEGNVYGSAVVGGTGLACEGGCGVVYKLTDVGGVWTQTVLHNFTGGTDGQGPGGPVTLDAQGNVYGMTPIAGEFGAGTIYQLKPAPGGGWKFRVIHAFTGGDDGGNGSAGRLLFDDAGNLFGVATVGGAFGKGVAFEMTPQNGGRTWAYQTIYAFKGRPDAGFPYGGLARDERGNLYGTTYYDGQYNLGAVYQLSPRSGGVWKERVLYSFRGGLDGSNSISNLVFDADGNLFGTTSEGGALGCGCGAIFKLSPMGHGQWTESIEHAFTNSPDGSYPYAGLVGDGLGNFFGATVHGGEDGDGSIYQFTP
jgi:uncharacterized repeat protein (TIGR03803 family)